MSLLTSLLDLLFPARCPFCGRMGAGADGPCPGCEKAAFWIPEADRAFAGTHFTRCVCAGWYQDELRQSLRAFKFQNHPEYAEAYGRELARSVRLFLPGAFDCITWMPVSAKRLQERGYDQARLLAEALGRELNKPVLPMLEKRRENPPQSSLEGAGARRSNVAGAYAVPDPAAVSGRRVLLADDILTTGATMEGGARTLREAGASQVVAAAFCKTPEKKQI